MLIGLASYHAMTHTDDVQTVHTRQTRSVCKPRLPACIQGSASVSTITSDPRLVFKAQPLFKELWYVTTLC